MPETSIQDKAKQAAGEAAADLIYSGMVIGIGTGTTVAFFISRLGERCKAGLKIHALATSIDTAQKAALAKIPLLDDQQVKELDLAIDGADEIDPEKQMIKGGGGALLREKITLCMAKDTLIIVDEKKCVKKLGAFPLPVEIASFGYEATLQHLKKEGFSPHLRKKDKEIFVTDNSNYIADLHFSRFIENAREVNDKLQTVPGVLETGLFLNSAKTVIVGHLDGRTTIIR